MLGHKSSSFVFPPLTPIIGQILMHEIAYMRGGAILYSAER